MNILIKDAQALILRHNQFVVEKQDLYIMGDRIAGIGKAPEGFLADKVLETANKLVIPGLINAHTHSYMSVFRNVADDMAFDDWLFGHILPLEDKLTKEDIYWGTLLGCMEMIQTGTTCFVDMNIDIASVLRGTEESGLRAVLSRGLVGEGDNEGGRARLKENLDTYLSCKNEKITFMLGPHAPYSCDPAYLKIVMQAAERYGLRIHIHLSESENEVADVQKQYGCTPIELMDCIGLFAYPTLAAHCVYATDHDIQIMAEKGVTVATNPKSNLKLANGVAPVLKMQEQGVNVAIGTDGAASNNTLNMFGEMNLLSLMHKGLSHDPMALKADDVLRFATVNGAKALGLEIGAIEAGMKADLAVLDLHTTPFYPRNNTRGALVYAANGSEVETVLVNGDILMENRELKTLDAERIYYECEKVRERIMK